MSRLLIANRGEIAARILRTAKRLGLETVCVFTNSDRTQPYLDEADQAIGLGSDSAYLNIQKIIQAAISSKSDLLHPGYGFLSENPDLVAACDESSIKFIGPQKKTLEHLGNKHFAKQIAIDLGVPVSPGGLIDKNTDPAKLKFPVLIKAVAGGGGRGMRVVRTESEFSAACREASLEAEGAFGNGELIVEALIENARHIEVQIAGDSFGQVQHFYERDCSVQRRHQKLIEVAPAPFLNAPLKERLREWSIAIGKKLELESLATVEFLVAEESAFFLEVNPRIQVEHPVSELLCDVDLVELQINIALRKKLSKKPPTAREGFAVEARLCSEIPERGFLPATGSILDFKFPKQKTEEEAASIFRVDHSLSVNQAQGLKFDSLLAKFICFEDSLPKALESLREKLLESKVQGLKTNRNFLASLLSGVYQGPESCPTTNLLDNWTPEDEDSCNYPLLASFSLFYLEYLKIGGDQTFTTQRSYEVDGPSGSERVGLHIKHDSKNKSIFKVSSQSSGEDLEIVVLENRMESLYLSLSGKPIEIHFSKPKSLFFDSGNFWIEGQDFIVKEDFKSSKSPCSFEAEVLSPIPGSITEVIAKAGSEYKEGDVLFVLESMKTKHQISAPSNCKIDNVLVEANNFVEAGEVLASLIPLERDETA